MARSPKPRRPWPNANGATHLILDPLDFLRRLAALERKKIEAEYRELLKQIKYLEGLLKSRKKILAVIKEELTDLKKKYGNDREKLNQAQMELYRQAGVNPLGGCLPLLIQLPIIIGLYQAMEATHREQWQPILVDEGVIVEIVTPGTGDPVPEGEVGEVVVTALNPDYPLIRFATGDLSAVMPGHSPCGRTNLRIKGWMGRADQTAKVRGMFVRPEQVAALVAHHAEVIKARVVITRADERDQIGQVTGLAWTEVGGELLTIESAVMPGKGKLSFTGQLGDVMQESVQAAMSSAECGVPFARIPSSSSARTFG